MSKVNLPTPSQAQLSPNILREMNPAVTAVFEREELGNQARKVKSESTKRLSCLRIALLLADVACPLDNSQSLELRSGLYSTIHNRLTMHSKPVLQYAGYATSNKQTSPLRINTMQKLYQLDVSHRSIWHHHRYPIHAQNYRAVVLEETSLHTHSYSNN